MTRLSTKLAMAENGFVELDDAEVQLLKQRVEVAVLTPVGYTAIMDAIDVACGKAVEEAVVEP